MNHRPFEDWLLTDQPLDSQQQRELQNHLRDCASCNAIAESNMALRLTRMVSPEPGFADRFSLRLARRREEIARRQILGTIVLVLAGTALTVAVAGPYLQEALASPATWITAIVGYFLFVITTLQVLSEASEVLLSVLASFLTPAGWMVAALAFAGLATFWTYAIRRARQAPQGV